MVEGGGSQKWIKNILNIINVHFATLDKGLRADLGKTNCMNSAEFIFVCLFAKFVNIYAPNLNS